VAAVDEASRAGSTVLLRAVDSAALKYELAFE
jgi:hypothetical protein